MQVDFYQLAGTPIEKVVPQLAGKVIENGERLLLVAGDEKLRGLLDACLWSFDPASFLPHAIAGEGGEAAQPILLSDAIAAQNGARFVMLADGLWRDEALAFARVFFLFDADKLDGARKAWRDLGARDDVEPRFWKQDGGKWRQGP